MRRKGSVLMISIRALTKSTNIPTTSYSGNYLPHFIQAWDRRKFKMSAGAAMVVSTGAVVATGAAPLSLGAFALSSAYTLIGLKDLNQKTHTILAAFPVLGRMRYILEGLRPEIRQYFIESDDEGRPFSRQQRDIVYARSKGEASKLPFGTTFDVNEEGYEWTVHSMNPVVCPRSESRTTIGGPDCLQPYSASRYNISAMSYGALSDVAVSALNDGAKQGGFYHNTGEGGVSRFHLRGADVVWNLGTGYFGARAPDGSFDPERFREVASHPNIKMIEIKLSQGAKPGSGGILPKGKITPLIMEARGLDSADHDCNSPSKHSAFEGPRGLVQFIKKLRGLSEGKPIGFKLCVGQPQELAAIFHAMLDADIYPDFITVDGSEGGTGAAPPELSNRVGMPLIEGLTIVKGFVQGAGLSDRIKIIASGKVLTGFDLLKTIALGADVCNAARPFMLSLGCIQARTCHNNDCPTGITTHRKDRQIALHVPTKAERVYNFQKATINSALKIAGASGFSDLDQLSPHNLFRRVDGFHVKTIGEVYPTVGEGHLVNNNPNVTEHFKRWWGQGEKLFAKN